MEFKQRNDTVTGDKLCIILYVVATTYHNDK